MRGLMILSHAQVGSGSIRFPSILTQASALRVEWAKAKVRADRWEEEVVLLNEEM